jgi:hypothetical protein
MVRQVLQELHEEGVDWHVEVCVATQVNKMKAIAVGKMAFIFIF